MNISKVKFQSSNSVAEAIERTASILQYGRILNVTDSLDRTRLQVRWLPTVLNRLAPLFGVS